MPISGMKFLSPVWSSASGSIGGTTYATGSGGLIARTRKVPTNPNTGPQASIRAAMGVASAAWSGTLSAAERAEWEAYAALTPLTNSLGQEITVAGVQMYQRWASLRELLGESVSSPASLAVSGLGQPVTDTSAASMVPLLTAGISGAASEDGDVIFQVSGLMSAGMNSTKQPLTFDVSAAISADDTTATATPVITLATNDRRVIRARIVYDDGRVSQAFAKVVTVTV